MIDGVQAFDRAPTAQLDSDDAAALERKIAIAARLYADRDAWLKPHQKMDILRRLGVLMEGRREHFGRQIARESGKPLTDAIVEVDRAIDGGGPAPRASVRRDAPTRHLDDGLHPPGATASCPARTLADSNSFAGY